MEWSSSDSVELSATQKEVEGGGEIKDDGERREEG